jgi:CheY-like chemotaxis protein
MSAKTILIADDSRAFRQLEAELLKRNGYMLIAADNGAKAVQMAARELPDLILLDLQMPVMDGGKALSLLKSSDKTQAIPVIMITTIGDETQRTQLMNAGAAHVILKPIDAAGLLSAIRSSLGEGSAASENS